MRRVPLMLLACGVVLAALVGQQVVLGVQPDVAAPVNTNSDVQSGVVQSGVMSSGNVQYVQANRLIGTQVLNANQDTLGKIDDLAIDQNTGKVRYVILSFGGTMGIGSKLLPVPWVALTTTVKSTTEGGTPQVYCVLNVDKNTLQNAPILAKDQFTSFGNQNWVSSIDNFYRPFIARQTTGATTR